jgi:hypothetical protein
MDYITNDVHATASVQKTATSLNEMFTKRKGKDSSKVQSPHNATQPHFHFFLFRLGCVLTGRQVLFRLDYDSQGSRKTDEEEMYRILESSVPGLVLQHERTKETHSLGGRGILDGAITGHKLLVSPDPFNIVHLLPPTISFLDRVKELTPYLSPSLPQMHVSLRNFVSLDSFVGFRVCGG